MYVFNVLLAKILKDFQQIFAWYRDIEHGSDATKGLESIIDHRTCVSFFWLIRRTCGTVRTAVAHAAIYLRSALNRCNLTVSRVLVRNTCRR